MEFQHIIAVMLLHGNVLHITSMHHCILEVCRTQYVSVLSVCCDSPLNSWEHYINVNNVVCIQTAPLYLIFMSSIRAIDKGKGGAMLLLMCTLC